MPRAPVVPAVGQALCLPWRVGSYGDHDRRLCVGCQAEVAASLV